ncbi:hypothetical protein C5167_031722 [Papaver somniferum]|uniref:mitogen-activated protein kinase kinase n=2 Tax=Papaver somniferum TaxID=3469 RepID=A0A4Y7K925_PAPSO|nr:hypothetical protein C5167_031722 [Papaver somniferum]
MTRVFGNQLLFLMGLGYTNPTYAAAVQPAIPVFTFVLAAFMGTEKVNLMKIGGQLKVGGTIVCVSRAILMVFFKGPSIFGEDVTELLHGAAATNDLIVGAQPEPAGGLISGLLGIGLTKFHIGMLCLIGNCFCMAVYLSFQNFLNDENTEWNRRVDGDICCILESSRIRVKWLLWRLISMGSVLRRLRFKRGDGRIDLSPLLLFRAVSEKGLCCSEMWRADGLRERMVVTEELEALVELQSGGVVDAVLQELLLCASLISTKIADKKGQRKTNKKQIPLPGPDNLNSHLVSLSNSQSLRVFTQRKIRHFHRRREEEETMKSKKPMSMMQLKLSVPAQETPVTNFLTASGTFQDGDLLLNQKGLRLISEENETTRKSDAKEFDIQFVLEDLETIKVIGKGSGGVVQLVRHKWVGTLFALKVIQMNIQEEVRKQIVQEVKINQASQCPHIVVCYHSFYHNGVISLVLEYMDRGSLVDVIKQVKTILEPYLAVVCKQVLQGLVYLHNERHVIHRDIKPSNLLVNQKGEIKITDFGVSAMLASSKGQRDTFVGTYNYMSPERISGSTYDYSSDIWSLGMVILECAIGRFPYIQSEDQGSPKFYELLQAIVGKPPPSAPSDQFSPEFCSFISCCIQKDPRDRMSSTDLLSHPFIKKFEDKDIDLAILVGSLEPPVNFPR